jgi:ABC-2 type transport system permease protein
MTRWGKVRAVAAFELRCTVRSKSWIILTFGMPLILLLYGGVISIPRLLEERRKETELAVYGLLDEAGVLGLDEELPVAPPEVPQELRQLLEASGQGELLQHRLNRWRNFVFRPFASAPAAQAALAGQRIRGWFRLPPDYVASGVIESYSPERPDLMASASREALGNLLVERRLQGRVDPALAERVRRPAAETRRFVLTASGAVEPGSGIGRALRLIVPLAFTLLLLLAVLMSAGGLIQATAVEKENRVVEVLLSSAGPHEILLGKLLGLGAAGALQMTVWFGMAALAAGAFAAQLALWGVDVPWSAMLAGVAFFALAYLFYGSLMLGTGSLGANQRESQQWGMIWSLALVLPILFFELLLHEPHGTAATALTWIPFTAANVLVVRLVLDAAGVAWWEVAGSALVLLGSTWVAIRFAARLFRVGLLLTGARPRLRELLRQARLG